MAPGKRSVFRQDGAPITSACGVNVWTVNDPADMRNLIAAGVTGIVTDYPDRLRDVLNGR